MPRVTMDLDGVRELQRALARLAAGADGVRAEAARAWAADVAGTARGLVPVDTGRLRAAIEARVDAGSTTETAEVGVWEPAADYSVYVEQGTSERAAQQFLLPAVEAHRADIPRYVREAVGRRLR